MLNNKKVSVILPTYNEKGSIYQAIEDFFASGYVDEIVVVNNNAESGTDYEVKKTKARLVYENKQGFGYAIQKGLKEATGEIIIISEPDGTFCGKDVIKLLAYSDDFDLVLGTRTTKEFIWEGANMSWLLRLGNFLGAKIFEVLFNTPTLSDLGCTMRLIKSESLRKIQDKFTVGGSCFNPEMVILARLNNIRFIEIPVNYRKRIGRSMGTKNLFNAVIIGLGMFYLIAKYRIVSLWKKF